jgi:hypothetical protein
MCLLALLLSFGQAASAAEPSDPTAAALHSALAKNISHAKDKLDEKDMKSLAQTAGGLQILAELLKTRSGDKAWQEITGQVLAAVTDLQTATRSADAAKGSAALAALEKVVSTAATVSPTGKPQEPPKPPSIRLLMPVLDGVYADAKIALLTGNVESAKKQALVLSELGKLVSNSRGEAFSMLIDDFRKACLAAANTTETNPQDVRQIFRGISQQCEACHKTR